MDTRSRSRAAARAAGTGVPAAVRPHTVEPQPEPSAIPLPNSPPPRSAPPEMPPPVSRSSQLIQEILNLDPATCTEVLCQFNAPTADWESTPSRIPRPIPFQTPLRQPHPQRAPQFLEPMDPIPERRSEHEPSSISQQDLPYPRRDVTELADDRAELSAAIRGFTSVIQQQRSQESGGGSISVRSPDDYDGKDPHKLHGFLFQLDLLFSSRPHAYDQDRFKVNTAISYLVGSPRDHFDRSLRLNANPPWRDNYTLFVQELTLFYGVVDEVNEAARRLDNLRMGENHHVNKYMIDFNACWALLNYSEDAFIHRFYTGLPNRIKDAIVPIGRPKELNQLMRLALDLDVCYWERQAEKGYTSRSDTSRALVKGKSNPSTSTPTPSCPLPTTGTPTYVSKLNTDG